MEEANVGERALRIGEVCQRVGMSRAWIYDQVAAGAFPQPIKLGIRASAWISGEVDAFIVAQAVRRKPPRRVNSVSAP